MRYLFYTAAVLLIFSSCVKEITPDFGPVDPKLVINTRFSPDTTWRIHISSNAAINTSLFDQVLMTDAVVEVRSETSGEMEVLSYLNTGFYESTGFRPEANHRYSISVRSNGFPEASASSFVPKSIETAVIGISTGIFLNTIIFNADLQITDRADEENYYLLEAYQISTTPQGNVYTPLRLYAFDANGENGEIGNQDELFDRIYLPDRNFNGENYSTSLRIRPVFSGVSNITPVQVRIISASKALYDYLKSYEASTSIDFDITFSEPIPVVTNIENGLGIFGGFNQDVHNLQF